MTIDPAVWRQIVGDVPLPDNGQAIRGTRRHNHPMRPESYSGVVDYVFLAEDEPCIRLQDGLSIFPTLGDTWEPTP